MNTTDIKTRRPYSLWMKFILLILLLFITINISTFIKVINKESKGKPHSEAKAYMAAAVTVNHLYIIPISKVFGYRNIVCLPLYYVRDKLYNKAISLLPNKDAESVVYWDVIRGDEFKALIKPKIYKYYKSGRTWNDPQVFFKWTDELYSQIEVLANNPVSDKFFQDRRFNTFIVLSLQYLDTRYATVTAEFFEVKDRLGAYYLDNTEVDKVQNILSWYVKLHKHCRLHEPDALKYFYNKTYNWFGGMLLVQKTTFMVLNNKLFYKKLDCNDFNVNMYMSSRSFLLGNVVNSNRLYKGQKEHIVEEVDSKYHRELAVNIVDYCNMN